MRNGCTKYNSPIKIPCDCSTYVCTHIGPSGADGVPGIDGPPGVDGVAGQDGAPGEDGLIFDNKIIVMCRQLTGASFLTDPFVPGEWNLTLAPFNDGAMLDMITWGTTIPEDYTATRLQATFYNISSDPVEEVGMVIRVYQNFVYTGVAMPISALVAGLTTIGLDISLPLVRGDILNFTGSPLDQLPTYLRGSVSIA